MLLLTWHGTILRIERETGRLSHARLVPQRDIGTDFNIQLPPDGLIEPLAGPNDMTLLPGPAQGTAHLMRGKFYLSAEATTYPGFSRLKAGAWELFLQVSEPTIAVLRDLLTHAWTREESGETIQPADIALGSGPVLTIGGISVMLATHTPFAEPGEPDRVTIPHEQGAMRLARVPGSLVVVREVPISRQPAGLVPDVADEAAFHAASPARLTVPGRPEIGLPPMLGRLRDRDFIYRRGWGGLPPISGKHQLNSQVVRDKNKFVLLERNVEGLILDETGVSNEAAYIGNLAGSEPPHFAREGDRYFLDRKLLDAAPFLPGPHVVFYGGGYQNYYHWLIDSMVPLSLIAPFLPHGVTLLLPGSLAQFRDAPIGKLDYIEVLEAFGFGDMKRVEMPGQICRVEEIYWPAKCTINELSAGALRAARDRVLARRGPASGPRTRIYVKRQGTREVANEAVVEGVLSKSGFVPVLMEDFTASAQIDLFRHAEMVVAAHGAALANLIFCQPDTKVLELSPDCEYRPFFNEISAKLDLVHAVLPCATSNTTFNGRLLVPAKRLDFLVTMLACRQAA